MAYWSTNDSGILRKNKKKDNFEDLLVFGYACKIFRDDEKAQYIDQGKHLIGWMGNENLKIDRYDCRGHLSDVSRYEASREGYDAMRWLGLDENERKLEQLCDEERYYSLKINEEEEQMYKEEEQKRGQTNEFQYSYDVPTNPDENKDIPTVPENTEEEEYVPPPELDVPVDIAIPKTVKENARIEKTAMFVSSQGPQMEILIKAKQSDNPQFSFLNQNDPLYKFYRHVLNAIKNGRYQIKSEKTDRISTNTSITDQGSGEHYLHPSLSSSTSSTDLPLPTIPNVPYRPSANCSYSQLVNRIQGASNVNVSAPSVPQGQPNGPADANGVPHVENLTYEQQQQYYEYYMQQQQHYYEYYKQMAPNSGDISDPNFQAYMQQVIYTHYLQHNQNAPHPINSYAQIVSNVSKDATRIPDHHSPSPPPTIKQDISPKKPALLSLIQNYGSDSDDEEEEQIENDYKIPEDETKIVIDKMASYVVKNGSIFENIVKSRADARFLFLNEDHEYHKYYRKKVEEETKKANGQSDMEPKAETSKTKEKKVIAPVCFSIKKPKDEPTKEIKSALPVDEDTDEEEEKPEQAKTSDASSPVTATTEIQKDDEQATAAKVVEDTGTEDSCNKSNETDHILEMIDLTEDLIEEKNGERTKDNRALQLERRKKAMAFLRMKTSSDVSDGQSVIPTIDLSSIKSPKGSISSSSENDSPKTKRKETDDEVERSKSHRKKETNRKRKSTKHDSEAEDISDEDRQRKRKKKSHKRKRSRTRHSSKRKKSKKKDAHSNSSDSE